ncbi:MAG: response regulator [Methanogenium sp.]|nr:response regulator [Methanogenium sp.]
MSKGKILVVEDEFITGADIQSSLQQMDYDVPVVVDTGEDAIKMSGEMMPDIVLMDISLKGEMDGIEAAEQIRERYGIPVVYLTAHSDDATMEKATSTEPFGYLIKPLEDRTLVATIRMALYKHSIDEKLHQSEETNRALLNAAQDALILLNSDKKIVAVNETMAEILRKSCTELIGESIVDLVATGTIVMHIQQIDEVYMTGTPVNIEEQQGERWFETTIYPIKGIEGNISRIVIQSHDITDRKHFEDQLRKEGLSQIEHNMEQFQILNDQIRNPLQVITGYVDLNKDEFSDQINKQIEIIDNLVTQLDQGWLESEKVRSFLFRHYRHGAEIIPEER